MTPRGPGTGTGSNNTSMAGLGYFWDLVGYPNLLKTCQKLLGVWRHVEYNRVKKNISVIPLIDFLVTHPGSTQFLVNT